METFIKKRKKVLSKRFDLIADKLLNETILCTSENKYRICEIEFYFHHPKHQDDYTHQAPEQLNYGTWYFHKFGNHVTFKEGTWKGMDLTLGRKDNVYCGILIRSIKNLDDKTFIEGPSKCVDAILKDCNCSKVKDFVNEEKMNVLANKRSLILKDEKLIKKKISKGIRIGLSDKYPHYQKKHYRFAIDTGLLKKKIKTE